jgi:hypothetical protein
MRAVRRRKKEGSDQFHYSVLDVMHVYDVRPRSDKRGFDLISDALPFGRLWYTQPDDAVSYAKVYKPIT